MTVLEMFRGDDRTITITATEVLEGAEVRWTAKWSRHHDADAVIEKSSLDGGGITVDDMTATVTIDAADTEDLLPGPLYWDVQVTDGLGKITTPAVGRLIVKPDVTHPAGS